MRICEIAEKRERCLGKKRGKGKAIFRSEQCCCDCEGRSWKSGKLSMA
jgi:hypothetical protein